MRRREFLFVFAGAMAERAIAREPGKPYRIGYLGSSYASSGGYVEAFQNGLRDLGYVDGPTVQVESLWADEKYERLPALAVKFVESRIDVIFAPTTQAAIAARSATATIPIVFAGVTDPVGVGLVASLARPGGNVTGVTPAISPELAGKQLEIFREAFPRLSRIAVLGNPLHPSHAYEVQGARIAAEALSLRLSFMEARAPDDFESAFGKMASARAQGLLVLPDPMLFAERARVAGLAVKGRLPTMFTFRENVAEGGLMSYGASLTGLFRKAAIYVDKILKGANPADLPVEQATTFELVINMKTAGRLGVRIPRSVLLRADEIIQ